MKYTFRGEGKEYPMLVKTIEFEIGSEKADKIGHTNYLQYFEYVLRNLKLPREIEVAYLILATTREIFYEHQALTDERQSEEMFNMVDQHLGDVEAMTRNYINSFERDMEEMAGRKNPFAGNKPVKERPPWERRPQPPQQPKKVKGIDILLKHGENLTQMAKDGLIDDCIGREEETWATKLTLCRRKKANPVLVGKAGVGKSQIVYGLAHLIARGEAGYLNNWTIIEMSSTGLVAGSKYVGELEQKMVEIITAVKQCPKVILFIDEIHTIMGTGKSDKSTLDIANILKPVLASGELRLIGATTDKEYDILRSDPAIERRFNKIEVKEPTVDETTTVLHGIKEKYSEFHNVTYYKGVVDVMSTIAKRYNPKRALPDSAVDIMDYCGALAKCDDVKKIRMVELKSFVKSLYNISEDKEVDVSPITHRELNPTIGF